MSSAGLTGLLRRSAARWAERPAAEEADGRGVSYAELDRRSDRVASLLTDRGVRPGDRVGIALPKSIDALICLFGVMKAGAAYVPVDPSAPAARNALIFADCAVRVAFVDEARRSEIEAGLASESAVVDLLVLEGTGGGDGISALLSDSVAEDAAAPEVRPELDELAYVLYTSGSTGRPKGVMLSHRNALAFVDWCSEEFAPSEQDRFSSHAPFHFDLSILDLYVPLKHGACVVLIDARLGKDPSGLAELLERARLSVWYSTPSILRLLVEYGDLGSRDLATLRLVLFAGEVFPIKHLRALKDILGPIACYNLYGPTETNVCTYYRVPDTIPSDRDRPYPIGSPCSGAETRVVGLDGGDVGPGSEGELWVEGDSVMRGYWNLPERTAEVLVDAPDGSRWYRTGDIVVEDPPGTYDYVGRRDRMVKRRGYRVELGEIEAGLYKHPALIEVAVVASRDEDGGVLVEAFVSHSGETRPSIIQLKRFCSEVLPLYMVPDRFVFLPQLPKTSTDKIDYQRLEGAS